MSLFLISFQSFIVVYIIYNFLEITTISAVLYFDDLFTISSTTIFSSIFFVTFMVIAILYLYPIETFSFSLGVSLFLTLFSISLTFGFVLLNDLLVSDIFDLFAELPLTLPSFLNYCGWGIIFFVLLYSFNLFLTNNFWFLVFGNLMVIFGTAGFIPLITISIFLIIFFCIRNYYIQKRSFFNFSGYES